MVSFAKNYFIYGMPGIEYLIDYIGYFYAD